MGWQLTYHVLPQVAAVAMCLGLAALIWRTRQTRASTSLFVVLLGVVGWSTTYAIQVASEDLATKLLLNDFRFLFVLISVVGYYAFAARYTSNDRWLRQPMVGLVVLPATITVALVFTNGDAHGLIRMNPQIVDVDGTDVLRFDPGTWFWVHVGYVYLLMGIAVTWIGRFARQNWAIYRDQAIVIVFAGVLPWAVSALYVREITTVEYTTFAISLSAVAFAWAMYRYDLLDLVPIARERVVEEMRDGVIVLDVEDRIVDLNEAALPVLSADEQVDALGANVLAELAAAPLRVRPPAADGRGDRESGSTFEHANDRVGAWTTPPAGPTDQGPRGADESNETTDGESVRSDASLETLVDDQFETLLDVPLEAVFDRDPLERVATEVVRQVDGHRRHYVLLVSPLRDESGALTGRLVVTEDVTAIKRRERELEATTAELEARTEQLELRNREQATLIENLPGIVYRTRDVGVDGPTFVSNATRDLTGYDPAAFESGEVSLQSIVYPDDRERTLKRKRMAIEDATQFDVTYRVVTNDETQRWVRDIGKGVYGERREDGRDPELEFVEGFVLDVTENKQREQLQVLNRVLRHNIRNEMNVVEGRLELAMADAGPETATHLEVVKRAAARVTRLGTKAHEIQGFLGTDGAPELEHVDATATVARALERLADDRPEEADVESTLPERLPVYGSELLDTAVYELLENAVVHADDDRPTVRVTVEAIDDDRAEIRVADDGPGIPPSELEAIDDREESPLVHGSGLGLWVVRWIVDAYGDLEFDVDDAGTTAIIRLRRVSGDADGRGSETAEFGA